MFEAVGCLVKRLTRTEEAGLKLGHVPLGRWRKLTEPEINMLKKIGTGKKTSAQNSRRIFNSKNGGKTAGGRTKNSGGRGRKTK